MFYVLVSCKAMWQDLHCRLIDSSPGVGLLGITSASTMKASITLIDLISDTPGEKPLCFLLSLWIAKMVLSKI